MANRDYTSESIEVLSGLEPVRKRPGMYTDTTSPNHLVMEVSDNSVDEALAGYAKEISVVLNKDFSVSCIIISPDFSVESSMDSSDKF